MPEGILWWLKPANEVCKVFLGFGWSADEVEALAGRCPVFRIDPVNA